MQNVPDCFVQESNYTLHSNGITVCTDMYVCMYVQQRGNFSVVLSSGGNGECGQLVVVVVVVVCRRGEQQRAAHFTLDWSHAGCVYCIGLWTVVKKCGVQARRTGKRRE